MAGTTKRKRPSSCQNSFRPVFGSPSEICETFLPTFAGVMKYYLHARKEFRISRNGFEPSVNDIIEAVTKKVETLEQSIYPTVILERCKAQLKTYHTKYIKLLKHFQRPKDDIRYKSQLQIFIAESKFFDIASC